MKTRTGLEAKIIYTLNNDKLSFPVIAVITESDGRETIKCYKKDLYWSNGNISEYDLVPDFEVGKTYKDGEGNYVTLIYNAPDRKVFPLIGYSDGETHTYTLNGKYYADGIPNPKDLIP